MLQIRSANFHITPELFNLKIESTTSQTPFMEYIITCYNSREQWMPRQAAFKYTSAQQLNVIEIDKPKLFCNEKLGYNIGFKFTHQSFDLL
jgi:hypothetical protein